MVFMVKVFIIIGCLFGIFYMIIIQRKYRNEGTENREAIIRYFKEQQAFSVDAGIKTSDLPESIAKDPFLLMMVKNKTLLFKKGKYYLNIQK